METFFFPFHTFTTEWPKNSVTLAFGSGYSFASQPKGPPQLTYHLKFAAMWWYTLAGVVDRAYTPDALPGTNIAALIDFYLANQLWNYFIYTPPDGTGDQIVRFAKPFVVPENIPGTFSNTVDGYMANQVAAFTLDFIQQPS